MSMLLRRILLAATAVTGAFVGLWAAAASARGPQAGRVIGVAWTVFGLPHLIYHATQFGDMAVVDVVGNIIGLGGSLLLGILLLLPGPGAGGAESTRIMEKKEGIG